jgi:hypothetical protein
MPFPANFFSIISTSNVAISIELKKKNVLNSYRGHPGLNWGPFDLQSNALPLSYTPVKFETLSVDPKDDFNERTFWCHIMGANLKK